jgi:hypothetical protein
MTDPSRRPRRMLLGLATLFFAPLLIAALLYFVFPEWAPSGKVNYGELVDPARPLPELQFVDVQNMPADPKLFHGRWSYVYLGSADCETTCRDKLFQIRQIRTLLNEKRSRVQRVYVAPDVAALVRARELLAADHPDLVFVAAAPIASAALNQFFGGHDAQTLYLLDPHANLVLAYPAAADSPGILKDIKRLLRLSQIG